MKIRLIQPAHLDEDGNSIKYKQLFFPFLTMTTVAALTPPDVEVLITEDYVEEIDFDENVDLVGLTGQTCQAPRAYQIAAEFKKRGVKTIMGGIHASICPDEAALHVDSVFVGEAEGRWGKVLSDLEAGQLQKRYVADERPDMQELAIPRFDLINFKNYMMPPFAKTPLIPIQTSRGCPMDCEFCSVVTYLGHKIRKKPVANVIKEIERYEPSRVMFTDDSLVAARDYSLELFSALKPMNMRWVCQMGTRIIDSPDLIEAAADAGCHECFIGVETIHDGILKKMNKSFNRPEDYAFLFKSLREVGILAQASIVFGFDGDNIDSLRRTIDSLMSWDVNYIYIWILTPLPGTKLRMTLDKEGRIVSNDWSQYDVMHPVMEYKDITTENLMACLWESYRRFYSFKNCTKRNMRFLREYIRYFPRDNLFEEVFFQHYMRQAVNNKTHPFTLGS